MSDAKVPPYIRELGDQILDAMRGYVSKSLSAVNNRLRAAEARAESADMLIADADSRLEELARRVAKLEDRT